MSQPGPGAKTLKDATDAVGAGRVNSKAVGSPGSAIIVRWLSWPSLATVMVTGRGPHAGAVMVPRTVLSGKSGSAGVRVKVDISLRVHHQSFVSSLCLG